MVYNTVRPAGVATSCLLAALLLTGCGGSSGGSTVAGPTEPEAPQELIAEPVVSTEGLSLSQADAAGVSDLLSYRMPAVNGGITEAGAVVLIPAGDAPDGGFPVVGWGHKAAGVSDLCAPSVSDDLRGSLPYLSQLLDNGYAVVAPDFEGLGTPDPHPYLNLGSGGRSMIYAINAAVTAYPELSNRYALLGHSQGGHAALGGGELADEIIRAQLVGVAAIAPPSQVAQQALELNAIVTDGSRSLADRGRAAGAYLINAALISKGVAAVSPEFDLESIFGNNGTPLLNSLELECIDELISTLLSPVTGALFISGNVDSIISSDVLELPDVQQYLTDLEPGGRATAAPIWLMQGLLDEVVFPQSTAALNIALGNVNTLTPRLIEYAIADHNTVIDQSVDDVLEFLQTVFAEQ
jgi:pimeloyl-ACP methyl ester carboxylesterase